MLEYVTEENYKKLLGKESVPSNFKELVIEASNYINHKTFGRIDINKIPEEVRYVTCLIVNQLEEQQNKINEVQNLKSESIEGWSKSYATPEEIKANYESKNYVILRTYLWNVKGEDGKPLLYCGVC